MSEKPNAKAQIDLEEISQTIIEGAGAAAEVGRNAVRRAFSDNSSGGGTTEAMVFPSVLSSLESIRPVINIRCIGGPNSGGSVTLPCPAGFGVTDGASYNDAELGFLGNIAFEQITNLRQNGADFNSVNQGIGRLADQALSGNLPESLKDFAAAQLNRGIGALADTNGLGKGIAVGVGAVLNKNVTTEFTGVGTRSFSFQYKLVPSSQEEGAAIGSITRFLRQGLYPSKSAAESVLRYPPRWKIEFRTKINGDTLQSIPRIAECYLESFATTYNGSNSFHTDGVPTDTDISLSFKEFRALTLEDINKLEGEEGLPGSIGAGN